MLSKATINALLSKVRRANVATKIRAVDLDLTEQIRRFHFGRQRLPNFVAKHESGFGLAVEIAGELQRADTLRRVHDNADRRQQIDKRHFARRENRSAGHRKLFAASRALEAAARGDLVRVKASAMRADRLAFRARPTQLAERVVSAFLARSVDRLEGEGPGLGGEEEMLGHVITKSNVFTLDMMMLGHPIVNDENIRYDDIRHLIRGVALWSQTRNGRNGPRASSRLN